MAEMDSQQFNTAAIRNADLWIRVDARGMSKVSEIEMAKAVYLQTNENLGENEGDLKQDNILGVQSIPTKQAWLVYMATKETKAKVLSIATLTVAGRQFALASFKEIWD